jgi:hypothetical protein
MVTVGTFLTVGGLLLILYFLRKLQNRLFSYKEKRINKTST